MANTYVNKVQLADGTSLIDISDTTATADKILSGYTAYGADGSKLTGTATGGGASNVVTGTFTGTTTGTAMNITLNYTGSGYPVAVVIYPKEGPYNASSGNFYDLIQRRACQIFCAVKAEIGVVPSYETSGTNNYGVAIESYKNSTSSATTYSTSFAANMNFYAGINAASGNALQIVRLKDNKTMSVTIATSGGYGFAANIEYKYWVLYSS